MRRVQRDEREPKCDGESVADGGDHAPAGRRRFCAGRERDADGQCGRRVGLWSSRAGDEATITVNASWELHRDGDGRDGCSATSASQSVTVNPLPRWRRLRPGPTTFCQGGSVTLTASAGRELSVEPRARRRQSITVNASWDYTVAVTDATGAARRARAKCDGRIRCRGGDDYPGGPTTFCAGRERDADGQCWEQLSVEPRRADTASDHGQCERGLHRDGDGCERVQRDERERKCDGQSVAAVAITPAGRRRSAQGGSVTLTASAGSELSVEPGRGRQCGDHGQCELGLHRDGDGRDGCSATSASQSVTVNPLPRRRSLPAGRRRSARAGA